jgi:hypothetical protein
MCKAKTCYSIPSGPTKKPLAALRGAFLFLGGRVERLGASLSGPCLLQIGSPRKEVVSRQSAWRRPLPISRSRWRYAPLPASDFPGKTNAQPLRAAGRAVCGVMEKAAARLKICASELVG